MKPLAVLNGLEPLVAKTVWFTEPGPGDLRASSTRRGTLTSLRARVFGSTTPSAVLPEWILEAGSIVVEAEVTTRDGRVFELRADGFGLRGFSEIGELESYP